MRFLNDRAVAATFENHVDVKGGSTDTTFSPNATGAAVAAFSPGTGRLFVVAVPSVLALAAHSADTALAAGLPASAGKNQGDYSGGIAWNDQFDALRRVAAVQTVGAGRTG
jgi:hypothetical protein